MFAAIINARNEVVFSADIEDGIREIDVAGAQDRNGYPVNRSSYRVSRSQRNIAKANHATPLVKRQHGDLVFYLRAES